MGENGHLFLKLKDVQRIQNELMVEKKEKMLGKDGFFDERAGYIIKSLQRGACVGVHEDSFKDFCDFLGEPAHDAEFIEVHVIHSVGQEEDIFKDQRITIKPVKQEVGILPSSVPSPDPSSAPEFMTSKFARFVSQIITQFRDKGIILIVGAGIDPILTGVVLDDFTNASHLKKYLAALLCALGLVQPREEFLTAMRISKIAQKCEKLGVITANWSYSLERNDFPTDRIQNTCSIDVEKIGKGIHVHVGASKDKIGVKELVGKTGLSVVFLTATSLRPDDFSYTGVSDIIKGAGLLIVNCEHDYFCRQFRLDDEIAEIRGYSELIGRYTMGKALRGKSMPFLKIVEDANVLFKEVKIPMMSGQLLL